jgi:hypothetical protein
LLPPKPGRTFGSELSKIFCESTTAIFRHVKRIIAPYEPQNSPSDALIAAFPLRNYWEAYMQYYRLYFLDHASRIDGGRDLKCANDLEACRHASELGAGKLWELWRGNVRVDCQGPSGDPA